ncbi:hypothetical protein EST38_g8308 [Candolleomyces aberdarensis]|uniref:F-box domain-containing protein n=1 Tax=Candolleomyces aberdarensis TaxID=2316362 RepID=A0A4V1Q369_9AGAR|nr:hypothetical protein EST38_g8308 [Candolleomyces aberdarensis]
MFPRVATGGEPIEVWPERWNAWILKLTKLQEATRVWMSRSGDCPITLLVDDIRTSKLTPPKYCPELSGLVDLLCQTSPRWERVEFRLRFQSMTFPTSRLLFVPPQTNPKLISVTLRLEFVSLRDHPVRRKLVSSPNIFDTPSIRSLGIGRRVMIHDILDIPINWRNLRDLDVGSYNKGSPQILSASHIFQLFKACPNLIKCTIDLQEDSRPFPMPPETITLPLLQDLSISPEAWHLPCSFASSLNLPSLVKFRVRDGKEDKYYQWLLREAQESGLCEFFERFGSTLRNVTFSYCPLSPSALLHCLHHLPNVTSLTLTNLSKWYFIYIGAQINRDVLNSFTPRFDKSSRAWTSLCPSIEEFGFSLGSKIPIVDETALLDFVEARRRVVDETDGSGVVRLRKVNCNGYGFRTIDPLKDLRSRRVDLVDFSFKDYEYAPSPDLS